MAKLEEFMSPPRANWWKATHRPIQSTCQECGCQMPGVESYCSIRCIEAVRDRAALEQRHRDWYMRLHAADGWHEVRNVLLEMFENDVFPKGI